MTTVKIRRDPSSGVRIGLKIAFDPKELGAERSEAIYQGIGQIAQALLDPAEIPRFLDSLQRATTRALKPRARKR